jgi:hypothetical protein
VSYGLVPGGEPGARLARLSASSTSVRAASSFLKLRLREAPDDHRRVLAVLAYLREAA